MTKRTASQPSRGLTLEQRRSFLKLPLAERRRLMEQQAARVARYYRTRRATEEREAWQGGDLIDAS